MVNPPSHRPLAMKRCVGAGGQGLTAQISFADVEIVHSSRPSVRQGARHRTHPRSLTAPGRLPLLRGILLAGKTSKIFFYGRPERQIETMIHRLFTKAIR